MMDDIDLKSAEKGGMWEDEEEYYSSQPGDVVSSKNTIKRRRMYLGISTVLCALMLIGIGVAISAAKRGMRKSSDPFKDLPQRLPPTELPPPKFPHPSPAKEPVSDYVSDPVSSPTLPAHTKTPTAPTKAPVAPTKAPVVPTKAPVDPTLAPVPINTAAPTVSMTTILKNVLHSRYGLHVLNHDNTAAHKAWLWMKQDANLEEYTEDRMLQRFALAAFYYATDGDNWSIDGNEIQGDPWMSNDDECSSWYGVRCNHLSLVLELNLTSSGLVGTIPHEIVGLNHTLKSLVVTGNDLNNTDEELEWVASMTPLKALDISHTQMTYDGIPTYLASLTNLEVLDVSHTNFIGPINGHVFREMSDLVYLEAGGNYYNSSFPGNLARLPKLEAVYLDDTGMQGNMEFVKKMHVIYELWLDDNDFSGTIPTEIGLQTTLASLSISSNNITGPLPSELGRLTAMKQMWFYGNWFEGDIPTELGLLENLEILQIEDNIMKGPMPLEVCALESIMTLSADCIDQDWVQCDCCTCCEAPCAIISDEPERRKLSSPLLF